MKKTVLFLLSVVMMTTFGACSDLGKEEAGANNNEQKLGGWQTPSDNAVTDELREIFDKAMTGYDGMYFEPLELLSTQIVAGRNYKFLCNGRAVVPGAETEKYIVVVYRNLKDECTILSVEKQ